MTSQQNHPITPPPKLVQQWDEECDSRNNPEINSTFDALQHFATQAAQWGADQELEACCEFLDDNELCDPNFHKDLRAARRPKPPSLKEQALEALQSMRIDPVLIEGINVNADLRAKYKIILCALEQLDD